MGLWGLFLLTNHHPQRVCRGDRGIYGRLFDHVARWYVNEVRVDDVTD